jgi:hypothetical protein
MERCNHQSDSQEAGNDTSEQEQHRRVTDQASTELSNSYQNVKTNSRRRR